MRYETRPGEQAQVDWGSFGYITQDGRQQRLYAFALVLGFADAVCRVYNLHGCEHLVALSPATRSPILAECPR